MKGHAVTMLGTGLIGDFYTNTLHGQRGLDRVRALEDSDPAAIESALARPTPDRLLVAAEALRQGFTVERINAIAGFDPWFLERLQEIVDRLMVDL